MDKLLAMQAFAAVVESGGFTRAAQRLNIPKGRVSRRVSDLEAHMGTRLLHRTTRSVQVTDDGRACYEQCVRVLGEIEELEHRMRSVNEPLQGLVRVDLLPPIARWIVAPELPEFRRRYPSICLHIATTNRLARLVEDGLDVAVRGGSLEDSTAVARSVADVRMGLYAAASWASLRGPVSHPADLAARDRIGSISVATRTVRPWRLERHGAIVDLLEPPGVAFDDDESALAASLAGAGVVVAAPFAVAEYVYRGSLVPVIPDWSAGVRSVSVMFPASRHLAPRVRVVVDWLVDVLSRSSDMRLTPEALHHTLRAPDRLDPDAAAIFGRNSRPAHP